MSTPWFSSLGLQVLASISAVLLAACGDSGSGTERDVGTELGGSDTCTGDCVDATSDATVPDTSDEDTAPDDADATAEDVAIETDAATPDAETDPTTDTDDAADTTPVDAGDGDVADADTSPTEDTAGDTTPGDPCDTEPFIDLDFSYVRCAESYTGLRRWVPTTEGSTCPPYFTLLDDRYDTADEALTAKACDTTCIWPPGNSFTVLRCGRRTGYILYRAEDAETCGDLYEFPEGLYPSVEAHDQAHPCPPEE